MVQKKREIKWGYWNTVEVRGRGLFMCPGSRRGQRENTDVVLKDVLEKNNNNNRRIKSYI